ncbi:mannitol-1-phosphate 5-dehydrogenase [Glaciihabitans tibetensis]|uniref:mannitol-1-phosphate 5-dehydrogenase n=1 Tax=Glaciihabitans tibetensis TaxID=1266600 RepID=UPI000D057A26|nr:mannitol-1-phosphate 5-dehydrogenase [Glaciihabitans tibetensis]
MKAVHFGAGNIGRGFVGLLLHNAGYEVVFADVNAEIIDALAASDSYLVTEVGEGATEWTVNNYRAINSATHEDEVIAEIATADVVTTAVGPNVLRFVAPVIAAAILRRDPALAPLTVMACENAINATDLLKAEILKALPEASAADGAIFANTAVDRIVPGQAEGSGLNVTVESFFEWAIESAPFGATPPTITEAHFVDDLAPYIERKLFTVNTGHAAAAYHGFRAGVETMSEAFALPAVIAEVRAVLAETKELLVAKHGFDPEVQQAYIDKNMVRFANPNLSDTVERVGRQPLRKLGRNERFVGPAAQLAERGIVPEALVRTMGVTLGFDVADDPQSVEMKELLASSTPEQFVGTVTGLDDTHPLFAAVLAQVRLHTS